MNRRAADSVPPHATLEYLESLHRRMEELAAASDWDALEALMAERDALLGDVPEGDRAAALNAAKASTDRILELVSTARLEVAGKLAKLRKGRKATDVYRANG